MPRLTTCGHVCLGLVVFLQMMKGSTGSMHKEQPEPEFAEPIQNITVPAGRDVKLACVVDNLGSYRVAWLFVEKYTLLTLAKNVITHNSRFKISHNGLRTWHLHIKDVEERDRGAYMCQINTSPMKYMTGYLNVVVPPTIDEDQTSSDTEVREGGDVSLYCAAKGTPTPEITWRREDDQEINFGKDKKMTSMVGNWLNITKVSRLHMSAYLCIASNGVLPSVSKRIVLEVSFAPMIWIPNQLVGAHVGSSVTLDCVLESHPKSVTYWTRNSDTIIHENSKYELLSTNSGMYKVQMKLTIRNLRPEDVGQYHCVAKNPLGETEGTIKMYEIPPSSSSTSGSLETTPPKPEKLRNGSNRNTLPSGGKPPSSRPPIREEGIHSRDDRPSYISENTKYDDPATSTSDVPDVATNPQLVLLLPLVVTVLSSVLS